MCAVRVSETLSRSPKRNLFDECIVIVLTIAICITSIHSLPSTVNWYHMVAWFPFGISQLLAFGFQLTGMYVHHAFNKTKRFIYRLLCCCCCLLFWLLFRIYLSFLEKCDAVGDFCYCRTTLSWELFSFFSVCCIFGSSLLADIYQIIYF